MALWPSDGLRFTGFEVKVSRGDLARELMQPAKAEAFAAYCDYWCLAVEQDVLPKVDGVEDLSLIPERWGIFVVTDKGNALRTVRQPVLNAEPKPLSRSFLAALLKRAQATEASKQQINDAEKRGRDERSYQLKHAEEQLEALRKNVAAFQEASGVQIEHTWDAGRLGTAVAMVMRTRARVDNDWQHQLMRAESAVKTIDELFSALDALCAPMEDAVPVAP